MLKVLLLSLLQPVLAFELLNIVSSFPKKLNFCSTIHPVIKKQFIDLQTDDFIISDKDNTGTICSSDNQHYGYMTPYDNKTDIWIKNQLVYYPNTLHNVAIHELYHAYGLDHSPEVGIMKYAVSVSQNWWGSNQLINDCYKIYPSIDDLQGMMKLKYNSYSVKIVN